MMMLTSTQLTPEGGLLLASLVIAALPIMLYHKHRAHLVSVRPAPVDDRDDDEESVESTEEYLLNACVPYLLAVQNIYASAKRRGVRFHGPMKTTDAMFARSRIATGSVWQYMREHDQLFTAEEIRLAVRVEFEAARSNDINWWNYEEDAGADAPADVEDIVVDIGDDEHDSDQDSDATNHSLASEYLRQFDEGEISEGETSD